MIFIYSLNQFLIAFKLFHTFRMSERSESKTMRLVLRPVGHVLNHTNRSKKVNNFVSPTRHIIDRSNQEIQPIKTGSQKASRKCQRDEERIKFQLIEDPRQSQFSFRKYALLQKMLLIQAVFYMFLCMIRTQILSVLQPQDSSPQQKNLLVIMDILTLAIILTVFMRLVCHYELKIDQKKIYCVRYETGFIADVARFVKDKQNIYMFLGQFCILILHPTILFKGIKVTFFQAYLSQEVKHDLNDIMCLASLFRIYLVLRALINITQYSTPRAVRLCNYNRINHDLFYSVKCLLQEHPLLSILAVFVTQLMVLGFGMRVAEGNIYRENLNLSLTGFENYANCFWCVFITMATVGYGDYFPVTTAGRCIGVVAAVSGIIVSSLMIVSLTAYLSMQPSQMTSHLTLVRLDHQEKLKQQATEAMVETMKLSKQLNSRKNPNEADKIQNIFSALKSKIDRVKYRSRQIKSLVNNNNIMDEMNRLFELLKQSLSELYRNQVTLKDDLIRLTKAKKEEKRKNSEIAFVKGLIQS